jgi:hypothetical protein
MNNQTVIVDGQALTIDDICHIAGQSRKFRMSDVPAFIGRINKGIALLSAISTRPALEPL